MLPVIREKLGDSKDQVREKTQVLIQQIMQESLPSNPQVRVMVNEGVWPQVRVVVNEKGRGHRLG